MRTFLLCALAAGAVLTVAPAHADPILTPLLVSAGLGATAFTIGTTAITYAAIASYAITTGAALALSSLLSSTPNQKVNPQTYQTKQALPPLLGVYGTTKLGGAKFYYEAPDGKLLNGIVHAEGPIDGFDAWMLNDIMTGLPKDASLGGGAFGGANVAMPWRGNVLVESRRGTPTQSAPGLLTAHSAGQWTADHRMDGKAYTVMLAAPVKKENFAKVYPNGAPEPYVIGRGYRCYDPRDAAMVWTDREHPSWKFSSNAGLAILHYLTAMRPGVDSITSKPVPYGFGFPLGRIHLPSFAAFAAKCDERVPLKGGSDEARYVISGTFEMGSERRADVLSRLLSTCDAELYQTPAGQIAIRGGGWTPPEVTISDEHVLAYEYDAGSDKLAAFNRLKVTFTDPFNGYQQIECDPWDDLENQALTGEVNVQDITLPMVPSPSQARRLAKIAMAKGNPRHRLTITTDLYGLLAIDQRIITLRIAEIGIDTTFLVTSFVENGDGATCRIGLSSLGPQAYAWDPAVEEGVAPARPAGGPPAVSIPNLEGLTVTVVRTEVSGTVTGLAIRATCNEPSSPVFELQGRIRPQGASDTAWQAMGPDGDNAVIRRELTDGVTYEVQNALWSSYGGTQGPWAASTFITAVADNVAPAAPTYTSATPSGATVAHAVKQSPSANARSVRLVRALGFDKVLADASLVASAALSPNQAETLSDTIDLGLYRYWLHAANGSGVLSAAAGPLTALRLQQPGNLLTAPNDLTNAAWTKVQVTAALSGTAPDGSAATLLSETTTNNVHYVGQAVSITSGNRYRAAVAVRANGRTRLALFLGDGGFGSFVGANVDLAAGTVSVSMVGAVVTAPAVSLVRITADWWLVTVAGAVAASSAQARISLRDDTGASVYAGDTTKGVYVAAATLAAVTA